eukprot:CAMPEP_0117028216 /NCGR_PEP_ID=MMETSP0472-20121206/20533_1 /TAXON_ID=693140 ORGANISM="Tiarina fusus, Strain LIS" /NCGR_SAMPLE_ID=MMETSP0472 /ASSEMBLY_ACC=CAM_ASM_000603 /LENGTH=809 /DNA_ID=CAMNT_0004735637 /DNA_START=20 /DNA_END=2449 /DNA_ORIENTATION=+
MKVAALALLFLFSTVIAQPPAEYTIGGLFEFTITDSETGEVFIAPDETLAIYTGYRLAVEDLNADARVLPNTKILPEAHDTQGTVAGALSGLVDGDANGLRVMVGPSYSDQSLIAAVASGVYDILLVSHTSSASSLSDSALYPLFARAVAPDTFQARIMVDIIDYYFEQTDEDNWREVGIICTADDYGVGGAKDFIDRATNRTIETVAFQQFLVGATDVEVEVRELRNSESRVFISYMVAADYQTMIIEADKQEIVGDFYVWICSDGCATEASFVDSETDKFRKRFETLSLGYMGVLPQGGTGELYEKYLDRWVNLDPDVYFGAGPGTEPPLFSLLAYESTYAAALAVQSQFDQGNFQPNGTVLYQSILANEFTTLTGLFKLEANGDRRASYQVVNLYPDRKFRQTFLWDVNNFLVPVAPTRFHDGTTTIPDLDVREEFDYWSCHDKEAGTDVTGKLINLETPDGDDVDFIKGKYECDQFIDCHNMSDEGYQCTPSFIIAFIIVGIITGIVILVSCLVIPIILVFGICVRRHRIFLSGTVFLVILALSAIFGFISTYTWYGKPHVVSCNFQLWLFGLSATSLACALFAKNFRLWRSTAATSFVRKYFTKSDTKGASSPIPPELEFFIYFALLMLFPLLVIILWTAISTPTAEMVDVDGDDHYICNTGGVTGEPGGTVFFFILVGYCGFLLFGSLFISFLVRHVPRPFMDKRLMSISVFNLTFLSAVVIPVFFVLRYISPFAAWLVRTLAIIYGFGSTLYIHMIPKLVGLFLIDRLQPNQGDGTGAGPALRPGGGELDPSMSASNTQSVG